MWAREKCKFINSWKHKFQKRLLICQNLATSLSDIQLFFVVLLNPPKTPQAPWACLQLCIDIIVCFALPLGNGLIVRKSLQCKRMLAINRMHRFKCTLNWLCNWYFMKLNMLNMWSFSTEPNIWTMTIFGSFMYFESLWLRMGDAVSLCQSRWLDSSYYFDHAWQLQSYGSWSSWNGSIANPDCELTTMLGQSSHVDQLHEAHKKLC
jgi:hypothetical protein